MRKLPFFLVAAAFAVPASRARAEDVQSCIAASEKGQRARAAGKLREARESFLVCGADSCPAIVRRDCVQWQGEIVSALPTLVFGAKDKQGRDLFDVTVTMDGEVVTTKLDGKAVSVDPGPHTVKFDVAGQPSVTEKILVKEGERSRVMTVSFKDTTPTGEPTAGGGAGGPGHDEERGGHTVFPWILASVGAAAVVAGVVVVATAPSRPTNCDKSTQSCTRLPGETDAQFSDDQDRAGRADAQPILGWAVVAGGALALVGGLTWHFLEPSATSPQKTGLRVLPWATPHANAAGVTLDARF